VSQSLPTTDVTPSRARILVAVEVGLVFVVFFVQGARPVPEVNEAYYVGKAIHFWNPQWIPDDPFLNSSDTHSTFYLSLGWLALFLPPTLIAWGGRLITWALLAWSWQRLSRAVVPWRWAAVWTAALFVCLMEHGHMAGEWVIGGVEAKGFAYVLTFLGLEALAKGRFNFVWPLLGAAAAFHVLVGGWAVVAAGVAWLLIGKERPTFMSMIPSLALGFVLSLPGLIPSIALTRGTDPALVEFANQIYVFQRLGHHLNPAGFPPGFALRFVALSMIWAAIWYVGPRSPENNRVQAFVVGTLVLSLIGAGIAVMFSSNPARAAGLLRFYWFRLSDVAVPLGIAVAGPGFFCWMVSQFRQRLTLKRYLATAASGGVAALVAMVITQAIVVVAYMAEYRLAWEAAAALAVAIVLGGILFVEKRVLTFDLVRQVRLSAVVALVLALLIVAPAVYMGVAVVARCTPAVPRADHPWYYHYWVHACRWIADSPDVPKDARFLTPMMGQTFKWYAQRSEVATWKDIPQDAESIGAWWDSVLDIYRRDDHLAGRGWSNSLSKLDARWLRYLGEKYDAPYLITFRWPRKRNFRVLYENAVYIVYRMDQPPDPPAWLTPPESAVGEPPIDSYDPPIDPSDMP
jgi:hypothetical protein